MASQFDKAKTEKNIGFILEKMKTEADPLALSEYRSLFKRKISFFDRSWAAAYLLMLYDQGNLGRGRGAGASGGKAGKGKNNQRGRVPRQGEQKPAVDSAEDAPFKNDQARYPLAEEESKYLFISIGRNRRVFPREILGLINSKTPVSRDDIGVIRILDNYSFVQVRDTAADEIIEALNGKPFRGRVLSVNYARTRKDGAGEEPEENAGISNADLMEENPDASPEQDSPGENL